MSIINRDIGCVHKVFLSIVFGQLLTGTAGAVTEPAVDYSPAELEELVGPVALYPDDLIAIVLPASSYPLQIVEAARYLEAYEANPDLIPDDDWDDAVVALLNYPEIIELMNEDLDWTWNLGEAVANQQADVLDAIQGFRGRALAAGNLKTDERQTVSAVDEIIEITPIESEVIYVPYYEPDRVVVYQRFPVYHYYPRRYPLYYYPYPAHYSFASGFFWGVSTAYTIGWLTDRVHFHHYGHASHPYYGHHYASDYHAPRAGRVRHHSDVGSRGHFVYGKHHYGATWRPAQRRGKQHVARQRHTAHARQPAVTSRFTRSSGRHGAARDPRIRSSDQPHARTRASRDKRSTPAPEVRIRDRSMRSVDRRRSAVGDRRNTARKTPGKTRVAVLDQSGNRAVTHLDQNRGSRNTSLRAGGNRINNARKGRPAGDRPDTRSPRRVGARVQPRQDHRTVQEVKRRAPESRAKAKPVTAPPTRGGNVAAGTRPARVATNSRDTRAAARGRHHR